MPETFDAAIVGGGVAGLVAANALADRGARIVLFEGAPELGGRARTTQQQGFCFDQGPHALYAGGVFRRALDAFGVAWSGKAPDLSGAQAVWQGALHPLPTSAARLLTLTPLTIGERLALAGFMARIGQVRGLPGESAAGLFARLKLRGRVLALTEALLRLSSYADAPDELDAEAAIAQLRLALGGVFCVDGGWSSLIDGLADRVRRLPGTPALLRAGARIAAVSPDGDGYVLKGGDDAGVFARTVVLAVDPAAATAQTPWSPELARRAANARPLRLSALSLALETYPRGAPTFALGVDSPTYLSLQSAAARLAPPGGPLLHAARYHRPGAPVTGDPIAEIAGGLDRLVPGWSKRELARKTLRAIPVSHDFPRGAEGGFAGRTPVRNPDSPGLFLAGDWVGAEGMLADAAAASGLEAARRAADRLGLP